MRHCPHLRRLGHWLLAGLLAWQASFGAWAADAAVQPVIEVAAFGVLPAETEATTPGTSDIPPRATRVLHRDTWAQVLQRLHVTWPQPGAAPSVVDWSAWPELVPAKYVRLRQDGAESPPGLDYVLSPQLAYAIRLQRETAAISRGTPTPALLRAMRDDAAKASLFAATDAVGLPEAIALQLAEVFADQVDFHRDLAAGYRCALVFEMYHPDGMPAPGRLLAAEFVTPTQHLSAFLHDNGNGERGYFDADGVDVNKTLRPATPDDGTPAGDGQVAPELAFRRSPLEFTRITSAPAALRYHPILKEWRAHRGTDYGAPVGTRVLATGDGEVAFLGSKGSFGKLVILRHFDRYTTYYGHLSAFAPGLKRGRRVRKGEVIGYVGMTGLATGPHLHYEFHAGARTAGGPLALAVRHILATERDAFLSRVEDYRGKLRFAQAVNLVLLE